MRQGAEDGREGVLVAAGDVVADGHHREPHRVAPWA
jgi:hypothetical protein